MFARVGAEQGQRARFADRLTQPGGNEALPPVGVKDDLPPGAVLDPPENPGYALAARLALDGCPRFHRALAGGEAEAHRRVDDRGERGLAAEAADGIGHLAPAAIDKAALHAEDA